jgi:hypothetical protein
MIASVNYDIHILHNFQEMSNFNPDRLPNSKADQRRKSFRSTIALRVKFRRWLLRQRRTGAGDPNPSETCGYIRLAVSSVSFRRAAKRGTAKICSRSPANPQ